MKRITAENKLQDLYPGYNLSKEAIDLNNSGRMGWVIRPHHNCNDKNEFRTLDKLANWICAETEEKRIDEFKIKLIHATGII